MGGCQCSRDRRIPRVLTADDLSAFSTDEDSFQTAMHPPDSESDCDDEDTFDILPSRQPMEFWMRPSKLPEEAAAVGSDRALCDKCIALIAKSSLYGLTEHHMREEMALRFVRGHKLDGEDAVIEALQRALLWRKETNISDIVKSDDQDSHEIFVSGSDRAGHPVLWWEVGDLDAWTEIELELANKLHIRRMERMLALANQRSRELGVRLYKSLWVVDLQRVGIAHRHATAFEGAASIDEAQYPEVVAQVVLINVPWAFKAIWVAVSWMIPERTAQKLKMCGTDYYSELEALVHPNCIPIKYGGRNPCDYHRTEHL